MLTLSREAWLGVRRRPLRTVLTAVSLFIGVVTLVLVQSSSLILKETMLQRAILQSGPRTTMLVPITDPNPPTQLNGVQWEDRLRWQLNQFNVAVARVDRYGSVNVVSQEDSVVSLDVTGVGGQFLDIRPFRVTAGSWFGEPRFRPQVVLNTLAWASFTTPYPTLTILTREGLSGIEAVVVGVVDDGGTVPAAYVSADDRTKLRLAGLMPIDQGLLVSAPNLSQEAIAERIRTLSSAGDYASNIGEITRLDQVDSFGDQVATSNRVFLAIAIMALSVGSLGILNIGLATVHERAGEVALRRALGASRARVAALLVIESQIVAVVASVGAVAVTVGLIPSVVGQLSAVDVGVQPLPVTAMATGLVASSTAAFLGSVAPSVKAARIPIASLLR